MGATGEMRTARVLDALAAREHGPTIFHDLRIPNANANIDHLVVSGRQVCVIDSKAWASGFYFTLGGKTRRTGQPGALFSGFEAGDKRTLPLAVSRLASYLAENAPAAPVRFRPSLLVVWPSSQRNNARGPSLWAYRPQEARAVSGEVLASSLRWARKSADPSIVSALARLVIVGGVRR